MNHTQLGNLIRQKRTRDGLSFERAARLANVSASTLCLFQFGKGEAVTGENLGRLLNWIGYVPEGAVSVRVTQPLPDVVSEILASDPTMTGDNAARLTMLFRNAYEQVTA